MMPIGASSIVGIAAGCHIPVRGIHKPSAAVRISDAIVFLPVNAIGEDLAYHRSLCEGICFWRIRSPCFWVGFSGIRSQMDVTGTVICLGNHSDLLGLVDNPVEDSLSD